MSNQRPSRCGGKGEGYQGKVCKCCKQPAKEYYSIQGYKGRYCTTCVRKYISRMIDGGVYYESDNKS